MRIRKRLTSDVRGRSKDAPAMWAAKRKYEEKHQKARVRADEEMDVRGGRGEDYMDFFKSDRYRYYDLKSGVCD